ncbi:hypothetical protein H8E88_16230 [candidate division KSB1 bacterium]|nr:hypothetical protein [candidate division KSB1 bacterium]
MSKKLNINFIFKVMMLLILNCLFITTLFAQDKQEIVVTINGISTGDKITHFNKGEESREQINLEA